MLGVIWALWHLPTIFVRGADTHGQSFYVYIASVTAISVAMAWLYGRTGSLAPVMLMHAAVNNTKDIVPSAVPGASNSFAWNASPVGWIALTIAWACALVLLMRMPKAIPDLPAPSPRTH